MLLVSFYTPWKQVSDEVFWCFYRVYRKRSVALNGFAISNETLTPKLLYASAIFPAIWINLKNF